MSGDEFGGAGDRTLKQLSKNITFRGIIGNIHPADSSGGDL